MAGSRHIWYSQEEHPKHLLKVWKPDPESCWTNNLRNRTAFNIYKGVYLKNQICLNSSLDTMVFKEMPLASPSNKKHNAPEIVFSVQHVSAWFEITLDRRVIFMADKSSFETHLLTEIVEPPTLYSSTFVAQKIGVMTDPVVLVQSQSLKTEMYNNTIQKIKTDIALNCSSLETKMWHELVLSGHVCGSIMEWRAQFVFSEVAQEQLISFPCDVHSMTLTHHQDERFVFPSMKIFWLKWETLKLAQILDKDNQNIFHRPGYTVRELSSRHMFLQIVDQVSWKTAVKLCEGEKSQLPEFGSKNDLIEVTDLMMKQPFQLAIYIGHAQNDTKVSLVSSTCVNVACTCLYILMFRSAPESRSFERVCLLLCPQKGHVAGQADRLAMRST